MRIDPTKTQKESTYQVVLDTLALSPCYNAFLITADVPEMYMQQFWFTISKIKDTSFYQFKLNKKKCRTGVEECKCLENELSKNHKLKHDKSFAQLKKHCINLELALQNAKEKTVCKNSWVKKSFTSGNNEKVLKEKNDSLIAELNRKTLKIHDLKAQLQDKTIVNAEMRALLNKVKGTSVDTKFEKPSVVQQPNAFKFQKPSILGKPSPFANSLKRLFCMRFPFEDQYAVSIKEDTAYPCLHSPKTTKERSSICHDDSEHKADDDMGYDPSDVAFTECCLVGVVLLVKDCRMINLIMELNEDILKITILKTNTSYPSRKIRRIRTCTYQRPQRNKAQYAVSREDQYAVLEIWNEYNILEDIKRVTDQPVPVSQAETLLLPVRIRIRANIVEYGVSSSIGYGVSNLLSNTAYSIQLINMAYSLLLNTAYSLLLNTAYRSSDKVIKGEFEKIKDVKVEDVSLTCDTSLEVFNNEVNRLSGMDDDSEHEADDNMGYDPSNVAFTEWLELKFFDYKTMDHYTMKALWVYWIRGDDEVELTDEESSDNKDEVAEVFRIDTNLFNFETPMCKAFKEFNYLLKIDPDLLTKDIEGFNTYEDYKDDWIYEWNKDVPWVDEKP
ncbi:hypothetical protein Tco_0970789 [Tanacetum coccineum]